MYLKHWKMYLAITASGLAVLPGTAAASSTLNAYFTEVDSKVTNLPEVAPVPLILMTLSTPNACGNNQAYLTPEAIEVPVEAFSEAPQKLRQTIDERRTFVLTLSDCNGHPPVITHVELCTPQACPEFLAQPVDGKLYLSENYLPVDADEGENVLNVPMPYDKAHKAWKVKIYNLRSGKLRLEGYVDNEDYAKGKLVYPYKVLRNNGKVGYSSELDADGLTDGKSIDYHENGKVQKTLVYRKGKMVDGEYASYDENGKVTERVSYRNGVMDGPYRMYYPSGKLQHSSTFVAGKAEGASTSWFENGAVQTERHNVNSSPDGWVVTYYANGKVEAKTLFEKETQRSDLLWNEQGVQVSQSQWDEQHREQGEFKLWHDNGQLKDLRVYKDGKLQGAARSWFENGQMQSSTDYVDGREQGWMRFWKEDGSLSSECQYQAGIQQGKCT
ncbi:toxin-antitoxin system YwqK family antitoxin [Pseudomonas purpurea]|uniref:toxin-antitoxin system YwqK family antitoxin n=1 Tax=Pseudomonas purpurea TaxID=3136737 RepID=UPI0032635C12